MRNILQAFSSSSDSEQAFLSHLVRNMTSFRTCLCHTLIITL